MKMRIYDFYSDPGHGWLKVKRAELKALNLLPDISHYSYQNEKFVYLEEDCDTDLFVRAMAEQGIEVKFRFQEVHRDSEIRNYEHYREV